MKPQDIIILLKIISFGDVNWTQINMARELNMSQSEVSASINRSKLAGLLDVSGKKVMRHALMEFLEHGIRYVFPEKPGAVVRGIPTAHSASPLNQVIQSQDMYVWPAAKGEKRGQSITPLYKSVVNAVWQDAYLHELLALVDAIRVGRARERELAVKELQQLILHGE